MFGKIKIYPWNCLTRKGFILLQNHNVFVFLHHFMLVRVIHATDFNFVEVTNPSSICQVRDPIGIASFIRYLVSLLQSWCSILLISDHFFLMIIHVTKQSLFWMIGRSLSGPPVELRLVATQMQPLWALKLDPPASLCPVKKQPGARPWSLCAQA